METVIEINEIVEGMPIVEAAIDKIRHDLNIREEVFGNVLIAVTEAVNNAYYHGNKGDSNKTVKVSFIKLGQYRLAVVVCDQGEGFDPDNLDDPTEPENIEKEGGRGVFLMRNLCDKLSFSEGGKVVELNFNI
ncbi:MAG: ATP-binding protein [Sphingobacteriia bacterium]|nr:ATP-binding protein [Sphingobacteriia bacterium]